MRSRDDTPRAKRRTNLARLDCAFRFSARCRRASSLATRRPSIATISKRQSRRGSVPLATAAIKVGIFGFIEKPVARTRCSKASNERCMGMIGRAKMRRAAAVLGKDPLILRECGFNNAAAAELACPGYGVARVPGSTPDLSLSGLSQASDRLGSPRHIAGEGNRFVAIPANPHRRDATLQEGDVPRFHDCYPISCEREEPRSWRWPSWKLELCSEPTYQDANCLTRLRLRPTRHVLAAPGFVLAFGLGWMSAGTVQRMAVEQSNGRQWSSEAADFY